jgi:hypothetical protein
MTSVFARRRSPVRAPRVTVAPSASPTGRACVRHVPIERAVYPPDAAPLRLHVQTIARLTQALSRHAHAR